MQRSDKAGSQGRDELIRDIGRSDCRCGGNFPSEHHLMRLAGDPLLVREFLLREAHAEPMPQGKSPLSGEATVTLARSIVSRFGLEQASLPSKLNQYGKREPLLDNSLSPAVFEPSRRDREVALEHDSPEPRQKASVVPGSGPGVAFSALALVFGMLLLTLLLVPD